MSRSLRSARSVIVFAIALAPSTLVAQAPSGRPLAIEDYYRIKTVGTPDLSPDGKWVAFTVSTRVEATNGNSSEVWLVATDASAPEKRLSAAGVEASAPSWTDDGRLHFSSGGRVVTYDPTTGATSELTTNAPAGSGGGGRGGRGGRGGGGGGSRPMQSPDGKWTAVVRDVPPARREKVYESEFAKRHEERFKGVIFDW